MNASDQAAQSVLWPHSSCCDRVPDGQGAAERVPVSRGESGVPHNDLNEPIDFLLILLGTYRIFGRALMRRVVLDRRTGSFLCLKSVDETEAGGSFICDSGLLVGFVGIWSLAGTVVRDIYCHSYPKFIQIFLRNNFLE